MASYASSADGSGLSYEEVKALVVLEIGSIIEDNRDMKITNVKTIWEFIKDVVQAIQKVDDEVVSLTSEQKGELAGDIIIWVIYDELDIDIPYVPDVIEKAFFKVMLSRWLIPAAVDFIKGRTE